MSGDRPWNNRVLIEILTFLETNCSSALIASDDLAGPDLNHEKNGFEGDMLRFLRSRCLNFLWVPKAPILSKRVRQMSHVNGIVSTL